MDAEVIRRTALAIGDLTAFEAEDEDRREFSGSVLLAQLQDQSATAEDAIKNAVDLITGYRNVALLVLLDAAAGTGHQPAAYLRKLAKKFARLEGTSGPG